MKWIGLAGLLCALAMPVQAEPSRQVIRARYTAADQESRRYVYVPFNVPAGTTRIVLTYQYDRAGGANTLDLGIFEPGSLALGTPALRGWSGGSRDTVTLAADDASPGYWPGPLGAGEWHAVLGLYRVAPEGVEVEVTVECDSDDAPSVSPQATVTANVPVPQTGPRWYAGVLHAHTVHSDGELTPAQLVNKASAEHLDFVAITDHNNTAHQRSRASAPGLLVITGEEVTTPVGHFNVWGLSGARRYVEFRIGADTAGLARVMNEARDRGAMVSINHPVSDCLACTWTAGVPTAVDALEIANGAPEARRQAMLLWDTLLRAGRHVTAVDGSDWHRGTAPLARPAVRVWAEELSVPAILDGLRHGRVVVLADGALPAPEFEVRSGGEVARVGDTLQVQPGASVEATVHVDASAYAGARVDLLWNGEVVWSAPLSGGLVSMTRHPAGPGYLRVHLVGTDGTLLAVSNPVYLATS